MAATSKHSDGSLGIPMSLLGSKMPTEFDTTWIFEHRSKKMPTEVDKTCIFEHRSKQKWTTQLKNFNPAHSKLQITCPTFQENAPGLPPPAWGKKECSFGGFPT